MTDLYPELIQKLFNINQHGSAKAGLENISKLNFYFGHPDKKFKSIHVAGTNGKGSVTIKMAKSLELAGYRVGAFTSPHITSFRERIRINDAFISESSTVKHLLEIFDVMEKQKIPATFFEITTMLALSYFASQNIDWGVFETGLGGRLDATNILYPQLSVITSISHDHTDILGNTLPKIAHEKAGIIKPGVPIVLGPRTPFIPRTAPFHEVKGDFATTELENREIANTALQVLGIDPVPEGLDARLPCRMEKFHVDGVDIILDVAHNPDGLFHLFKTLKGTPLRVVFGMSKTKDLLQCVEIVKKGSENIHIVDVSDGRGHPISDVERAFHPTVAMISSSIQEGVYNAIQLAKKNSETVLICGSCYIMSEAMSSLVYKTSQ